jgi:hypothetical protein
MKLSRRDLAVLAATPLISQAAPAQTPPPAASTDPSSSVREANRRNSEALLKFAVPVETEPAFRFEP